MVCSENKSVPLLLAQSAMNLAHDFLQTSLPLHPDSVEQGWRVFVEVALVDSAPDRQDQVGSLQKLPGEDSIELGLRPAAVLELGSDSTFQNYAPPAPEPSENRV